MERDPEKDGVGDERLHERAAEDQTPYDSEAAFRHRQQNDADIPEIRSTQLIPGPLEEVEEPELASTRLKFNQQTRHDAR